MSQFMPDTNGQSRRVAAPARGEEAYLSVEERKFLQRFLSYPEDLPPRFKSWILDHVAVNIPQIPISQIVGFTQFTPNVATTILTSESTTSTSYANLATTGPELLGLADGVYLILFGCQTAAIASGEGASVSISVNGDTASDDDSCVAEDQPGSATIMRAVAKELRAGGSNTIRVQYRVNAGTGTFLRRWLIAIRMGN